MMEIISFTGATGPSRRSVYTAVLPSAGQKIQKLNMQESVYCRIQGFTAVSREILMSLFVCE